MVGLVPRSLVNNKAFANACHLELYAVDMAYGDHIKGNNQANHNLNTWHFLASYLDSHLDMHDRSSSKDTNHADSSHYEVVISR